MDYKRRKRTPSDREMLAAKRRVEVIRLWGEGMSRDEIARQMGFTATWVGQIIFHHRMLVILAELLGPEEGRRVFDRHEAGLRNLLKEHRWSPTREQVMKWVEEEEAFYREHRLRMADCASTLEN